MSVGLDVHARSVVAVALDGVTGEVHRARLAPEHERIVGWIAGLAGPVAVAYEAGPSGFGLARDLVRTREDCRGELMAARHRLWKLLLRQGILYSGRLRQHL
jgi:hypothetical protein